jgi:uncharacterized protein (DUF362 family)
VTGNGGRDIHEPRVGLAVAPAHRRNRRAYDDEPLVESLVHDALVAGGLGRTSATAPLADVFPPGATVLVKPNWVNHRNLGPDGNDCLVTHPAFILAVLREVAAARPVRVVLGDAPIQDCRFSSLLPPHWEERFAEALPCPLEVVDFRRVRFVDDKLVDGVIPDARPEERYVLFDLAGDSLLEPITTRTPRFRVTKYDPRELARTHRRGRHQYLLCREAFEADVLLSLPKLKTHMKAGLTGALKNVVGLNGNKDFLPHHRVGGSMLGGDCYPGASPVKRAIEYCFDRANRNIGAASYLRWSRLATRLHRLQERFGEAQFEGGWHGNDTVWRMALDLNRLLLYGDEDGSLAPNPRRGILSLTDAIVAGEGEGPLSPSPRELGAVTFATSSPFADLVHTALLRFDWRRIPLVREAFAPIGRALTSRPPEACETGAGSRVIALDEVAAEFGQDFVPARGWRGFVELDPAGGRR